MYHCFCDGRRRVISTTITMIEFQDHPCNGLILKRSLLSNRTESAIHFSPPTLVSAELVQ
jgi:hypothetical protein